MASTLTLDGAEAPALVLAVVKGGGTPQMAVLPAHAGAAVEPLAIVQEGQEARPAVRVPLDGVDLWGTQDRQRQGDSGGERWIEGERKDVQRSFSSVYNEMELILSIGFTSLLLFNMKCNKA